MKPTSVAQDRQIADLMEQPQALFALWAIRTDLCTSVKDFQYHFGAGLPAASIIDTLHSLGFVQKVGRRLVVTDVGIVALSGDAWPPTRRDAFAREARTPDIGFHDDLPRPDEPVTMQDHSVLPMKPEMKASAIARSDVAAILLIDPDIASAEQLAQQLRGRFAIAVVPSAQAARSAMSIRMPDLVVTELDLPDANGLLILSQLRNTPATQHVLLVVVTTRSSVNDKIAAFQAGADDYLVKPVDAERWSTHLDLITRFAKRLHERSSPTKTREVEAK